MILKLNRTKEVKKLLELFTIKTLSHTFSIPNNSLSKQKDVIEDGALSFTVTLYTLAGWYPWEAHCGGKVSGVDRGEVGERTGRKKGGQGGKTLVGM